MRLRSHLIWSDFEICPNDITPVEHVADEGEVPEVPEVEKRKEKKIDSFTSVRNCGSG